MRKYARQTGAGSMEESLDNKSAADGKATPSAIGDRLGILALLLPALGYASAYLYRQGEAQFYGLPPELVTLDLKDVVVGGLGIATAIILTAWIINVVVDALEGVFHHEVERAVLDVAVPMTGVAVILYLAGTSFAGWLGLFMALLVMLALQLGMPLFTRRDVHGYPNKLKAVRETRGNTRAMPLTRFLRTRRDVALLLAAAYVIVFAATPAGVHSARSRRTFAFIDEPYAQIVVGEYHDSLVTLAYDSKTHAASPPIRILDPQELAGGVTVERNLKVKFGR